MTSDGRDGRFIGYFRLVDRCRESGCPVCRSLVEESRDHLRALLYEQVTDPETRRRIRGAWGFCSWHAAMLSEIEDASFGAAIIYEDILGTIIRRARQLVAIRGEATPPWGWFSRRQRRPKLIALYERREACPTCAIVTGAETRYVEVLVKFVDDRDLADAYRRSDGVCLRHALRALELFPERNETRVFLERTIDKWEQLHDELGAFVRKHDYRNTVPYTEAEAISWRRTLELLAGANGVFGSDVHKPVERPVGRRRSAGAALPRHRGAGRGSSEHRPESEGER